MSENPIRVELNAPEGTPHPIDEPPELSVRIVNVSDEPIWMIGVLPGSEGMRYPLYRAEIEGPSGPVRLRLPEALDYARGLRQEDFVRLEPGESFDPQQGQGFVPIQQLAWFKPKEPGVYRVRIVFDATADNPRDWLGQTPVRASRQVTRLIKRVPHARVWSNTVEIEFE